MVAVSCPKVLHPNSWVVRSSSQYQNGYTEGLCLHGLYLMSDGVVALDLLIGAKLGVGGAPSLLCIYFLLADFECRDLSRSY